PRLHAHRFGEWFASLLSRRRHQPEQRAPIYHATAREMTSVTVAQPNLVRAYQDKTHFIDPAAPSPSEHLQNFVGLQRLLLIIAPIRFSGAAVEGRRNSA